MNNRYYVLTITKTSEGTEARDFMPYSEEVTARRKYYQALTAIGTGLKGIVVLLLDPYLNVLKKDMWEEEPVNPDEEVEPQA